MTLSEKKQKIQDTIKDNPGYFFTLDCGEMLFCIHEWNKISFTDNSIIVDDNKIPLDTIKRIIIEEEWEEEPEESFYCDATIDDTY